MRCGKERKAAKAVEAGSGYLCGAQPEVLGRAEACPSLGNGPCWYLWNRVGCFIPERVAISSPWGQKIAHETESMLTL